MKQRIKSVSWRTDRKKFPERAKKGKKDSKRKKRVKEVSGQHET